MGKALDPIVILNRHNDGTFIFLLDVIIQWVQCSTECVELKPKS